MDEIEFVLNGVPTPLGHCDPTETLLDWLRARGLTGTKEGCAEGECGACAVAMIQRGSEGHAFYEAIDSCLLPMGAVVGREIITVEGIGTREHLHPVQQSVASGGGSQCGYCTPGFIVSMFAEYYRWDRQAGEFDGQSISGNLCRCTGYRPIAAAGASLGKAAPDDPFVARLERATSSFAVHPSVTSPATPSPSMISLPEKADSRPRASSVSWSAGGRRWCRPMKLDEAIEQLAAVPEARAIAGGTDLVVERNLRGTRWTTLVSLEAVAELNGLEFHEDRIEIGAALNLREIGKRLSGRLPMMDQLLPLFSSPQIRARATLGGNLATASPIGDGAPVLLALGASLRLAGPRGERHVPLEEFFTGYRETVLEPAELIVSILVPLPLPRIARFYKVSKRELDDISTVAAAFAIELDGMGRVTLARLAYGGVAPTPVRAKDAEAALIGQPWERGALAGFRGLLETAFHPIDDHRGSARYRRSMVWRLLEKFCAESSTGDASVEWSTR